MGLLALRHFGLAAPLLGLALLLAPAPARALDKAEDEAKAKFFEALRAAAEDDAARAEVVGTLASLPDELKVTIVLDKVFPLEERLGSPSAKVLAAGTRVLRTVKDEGALKALVAAGQGKGSWSVRTAVLEALGGIDSRVALDGLLRVLKKGDTVGMSGALFALAERHPPEALEEVKKALDHSAWQVRLGALEYFSRLKDPSTVPLLVDRLEEESGRIQHEVADALRTITGRDFKTDAARWRAYASGGEEAVGKLDDEKKAEEAAAGGRAVSSEGTVKPTYYGEPVYSDKVVFVIDLSLSMNAEMAIDRDRLVRETGAVVSGGPDDAPRDAKKDGEIQAIEWWKIRTRLDFAKAQLKYAISTLTSDQTFDVVWYSEKCEAWMGQMVPARRATKMKASAWIDGLQCEGGTNTWGGLTRALNLVGRGTETENYARGADTLYFMSDGEPSVGDIVDKGQILSAIERIHKVRRVKIHVVQIGRSRMEFMIRLARITGGNYRFFQADPEKGK